MEERTVTITLTEYTNLIRSDYVLGLLLEAIENNTEYKFVGYPFEGLKIDDTEVIKAYAAICPARYKNLLKTAKDSLTEAKEAEE